MRRGEPPNAEERDSAAGARGHAPLLALKVTPEIKCELERCAELRRALIRAGWFN